MTRRRKLIDEYLIKNFDLFRSNFVAREDTQLQMTVCKMNAYILENIILGNLKIGAELPFDKYLRELSVDCNTYELRKAIIGKFVTANEKIDEIDIEENRRRFFDMQIDGIFGLDNITGRMKTYFDGLFDIFCSVLDTPIESVSQHGMLTLNDDSIERLSKFLVAIKQKKIHTGSGVGRYIARAQSLEFVERMIGYGRGARTLQVDDINIIEYKLTILSVFRFIKDMNAQIFMTKIMNWFEINRCNQSNL